MTKYYLSSNEKKSLKEFRSKVSQKLKGRVLSMKIFGSKARNDFRKTSDIDILVLMKTPNLKDKETIFEIAAQVLIKYGVDLSVKVFSLKEFRRGLRLEIPFYINVNREALLL